MQVYVEQLPLMKEATRVEICGCLSMTSIKHLGLGLCNLTICLQVVAINIKEQRRWIGHNKSNPSKRAMYVCIAYVV